MDRKAQSGFTLYELLVTLMVAGVIIGFGLPSLRQFQLNNRMVAASNDMLAVFSMARTEAIKRKTNVTICTAIPDNDPDCDNTIVWHEGWVAFVDEDGDLNFDAGDGDEILRSHGKVTGNAADPADAKNIKVATNNNAFYFSFRATGFGRGDVGAGDPLAAAYIYDQRGNDGTAGNLSTARLLTVSAAGRAQVIRDPVLITNVCQDANNNLVCPIL